MRRRGLIPVLGVLAALGAGCATIAPPPLTVSQADGFVYQDAWGIQMFAWPANQIQPVVFDAFRDLQMWGLHKQRAGASWVLDARAHDGRHVHAIVEPVADGSRVAVRIGRIGDKVLARAVAERVGVRLGTLPPSPPPQTPPVSPRRPWFALGRDSAILSDQTISQYRDFPIP